MNNISKAEKNLKKKLSLDDYAPAEQVKQTAQQAPQGQTYIPDAVLEESGMNDLLAQAGQSSQAKIKVTYYLSEDDHGALTNVYIKRLQNKQKTDRSALVSEAIRLLYKKEME